MTIKSKLIANLVIVSVLIALICLGSYSSLRFIQDRFLMVAEKSMPHQVRSMAFERELQHSITLLTRMVALQNLEEFAPCKGETEISLNSLAAAEKKLEESRNSAAHLDVTGQIKMIALDLFSSTEERLLAEKSAIEGNEKITENIETASAKLKSLETGIGRLQTYRLKLFEKSLHNTNAFSAKLRGIEDLRNNLKELQANLNIANYVDTKAQFIIIRGKINTNLWRLENNRFSDFFVVSDIKNNSKKIKRFIELKNEFIVWKKDPTKQEMQHLLQDIQEQNNQLQLTLNQEIEILSSRLEGETKHESIIYEASNQANAIMLNNSRLVSLGHSISADISRLFIVETQNELERRGREIKAKFQDLHNLAEAEERDLIAIGAKEELLLLKSAHQSLETIRDKISSGTGVLNTLTTKLKSKASAEKGRRSLKNIAEKQAALGRETVLLAQYDQKNAVDSVKSSISQMFSRVTSTGIVAVLIGMTFGYWVLRSILRPLKLILNALKQQTRHAKDFARLAESVASGNLSSPQTNFSLLQIDNIPHDEFGSALHEIVAMNAAQLTHDKAFSDMTNSLREHQNEQEAREKMATARFDLNTILRNEEHFPNMPELALSFILEYLGASIGILYLFDDRTDELLPIASYALSSPERMQTTVRLGEGIVGEAALKKKNIEFGSLPPDYLTLHSALVSSMPNNLLAAPLVHNETVVAVMEMGSFSDMDEHAFQFMVQALDDFAVALMVERSRRIVDDLLEQSQTQAEELRAQQEELHQMNEVIMERSRGAKWSPE